MTGKIFGGKKLNNQPVVSSYELIKLYNKLTPRSRLEQQGSSHVKLHLCGPVFLLFCMYHFQECVVRMNEMCLRV